MDRKLLKLYKDSLTRRKEDMPLNQEESAEVLINDMNEMKRLMANKEAVPELKTDEATGQQSLTIYDREHKKELFYTDISWNITYLLKDIYPKE